MKFCLRLFLNTCNLLNIAVLLISFLVSTVVWGEPQNNSVTGHDLVSAEYVTTQCAIPCKTATKQIWWMFRTPTQVEFRDISIKTGLPAKNGELWRFNPDGKLNYVYLMHQDKRAIEYLFDDLRILGITADQKKWEVLTQLITKIELQTLKKLPTLTAPVQGFETEAYTGKIQGAKVDVTWLPQLNMPVEVVYTYPQSTVTVSLKMVNVSDKSSQNFALLTTEQQLDTYQRVYYTDIGDMEQNAEAEDWIIKAQGAPGLHHHQH